ncbi:hypothetical protein BgAZ_501640 [Babesia gibsoni]|uniref:Uncharacterized protein n=1 Tax=Babesia gibsoni TaxID=33632 RepID=A0AAD8LHT1_BABGI|nr:hypothetical protein BgAZ_501640 [Babesia gibsoni]
MKVIGLFAFLLYSSSGVLSAIDEEGIMAADDMTFLGDMFMSPKSSLLYTAVEDVYVAIIRHTLELMIVIRELANQVAGGNQKLLQEVEKIMGPFKTDADGIAIEEAYAALNIEKSMPKHYDRYMKFKTILKHLGNCKEKILGVRETLLNTINSHELDATMKDILINFINKGYLETGIFMEIRVLTILYVYYVESLSRTINGSHDFFYLLSLSEGLNRLVVYPSLYITEEGMKKLVATLHNAIVIIYDRMNASMEELTLINMTTRYRTFTVLSGLLKGYGHDLINISGAGVKYAD